MSRSLNRRAVVVAGAVQMMIEAASQLAPTIDLRMHLVPLVPRAAVNEATATRRIVGQVPRDAANVPPTVRDHPVHAEIARAIRGLSVFAVTQVAMNKLALIVHTVKDQARAEIVNALNLAKAGRHVANVDRKLNGAALPLIVKVQEVIDLVATSQEEVLVHHLTTAQPVANIDQADLHLSIKYVEADVLDFHHVQIM